MMNTLHIHENKIDLIGFDDLNERAYFIFRTGGLAISSSKEDVHAKQTVCDIHNRTIENEELSNELIEYGFLEMHMFTKGPDGIYYSPYPKH